MDKSISERLEGVPTLENIKLRLQKDLKLETDQNIMNKASQWAEGVALGGKSLMRTPQGRREY